MFAQDSRDEDRKCRAHTGVEVTRMRPLEVSQLRDHHGCPERTQVISDACDRLLVGEADAVGGDLPGHAGQGLGAHGYAWTDSAPAATVLASGPRRVGVTSTAVTLYSGQLVAQSEYSVVMTLAPLPGKWNVV